MIFDQKIAQNYDKWYRTDFGRYAGLLEEQLMTRLIGPIRGLKILDVGCGTGNHLKNFQSLGADVLGLDCSFAMLKKAKEKGNFKLVLAKGEQLPIKNSVFDMATVITTLEFCEDPAKVLREMGRVTKEKIFIGVLNRWSLLALGRRIKGWFKPSIYDRASFFSIRKIRKIIKDSVAVRSVEWNGVCFLPFLRLRFLKWLDRKLSFKRNPFSAFLGIVVTLNSESPTGQDNS